MSNSVFLLIALFDTMGKSLHTMGSLFPSSFEHSLNCFGYLGWAEVPNVRFIEVVFDKVTGQPRVEEGLLHEKNIEAWLDMVCSEIREIGLSKLF